MVETVFSRVPLRWVVRVGVRSYGLAPMWAVASASTGQTGSGSSCESLIVSSMAGSHKASRGGPHILVTNPCPKITGQKLYHSRGRNQRNCKRCQSKTSIPVTDPHLGQIVAVAPASRVPDWVSASGATRLTSSGFT